LHRPDDPLGRGLGGVRTVTGTRDRRGQRHRLNAAAQGSQMRIGRRAPKSVAGQPGIRSMNSSRLSLISRGGGPRSRNSRAIARLRPPSRGIDDVDYGNGHDSFPSAAANHAFG
jgi:hypothetical protein